jgi:hypothetical protein
VKRPLFILGAAALIVAVVATAGKSSSPPNGSGAINYVKDSTLPDGSTVHTGTAYTKTWKVKAVSDTRGIYLQRVVPSDSIDLLRVNGNLDIGRLGKQSWVAIPGDTTYSSGPTIIPVPDIKGGAEAEISIPITFTGEGRQTVFYRTVFRDGDTYIPTRSGYSPLWIDVHAIPANAM